MLGSKALRSIQGSSPVTKLASIRPVFAPPVKPTCWWPKPTNAFGKVCNLPINGSELAVVGRWPCQVSIRSYLIEGKSSSALILRSYIAVLLSGPLNPEKSTIPANRILLCIGVTTNLPAATLTVSSGISDGLISSMW